MAQLLLQACPAALHVARACRTLQQLQSGLPPALAGAGQVPEQAPANNAAQGGRLGSHLLQEGVGRVAGPIPQVGWVDADSQPSFLRGLGLAGPEDAPTCLLLQRSQQRVARMAASFSADAVAQLLVRGNFQPLRVRRCAGPRRPAGQQLVAAASAERGCSPPRDF